MATSKEAVEVHIPWDWFLDQARDGDGSILAAILRDHAKKADESLPSEVWVFLADVLEGKANLKRRKKLTEIVRFNRNLQEKMVQINVRDEMFRSGKKRDKQFRTKLIKKWCKIHRTTPAKFERFLHLSKLRRK